MKKGKNRSDVSLQPPKPESNTGVSEPAPLLDALVVKVLNLRLPDDDPKHFAIKVTFCDQLILTGIIRSIGARDVVEERTIVRGAMSYDPADYEKMCLMADSPLIVHIQPLRSVETNMSTQSVKSPKQSFSRPTRSNLFSKAAEEISCCNIDILNIFLGDTEKQNICVKYRMQPMVNPSTLYRKSWNNLPLLTMEVSVARQKQNARHHKMLKEANWMKLTLVAAYNLITPYDDEFLYTAASRTPMLNDSNFNLAIFNQGYRMPNRFKGNCFYPKWESLRVGEDVFTLGDDKFVCEYDEIQNDENIDLVHYMDHCPEYLTTVWGSFHRTLMLENADQWFWEHLRHYRWPLELHIYGENAGYSFMGFMNLFNLLYPGEDTIRLVVPLKWVNAEMMLQKCGCDLLLTPNDRAPSTPGTLHKTSRITTESGPTVSSAVTMVGPRPTGADDTPAFVLVEVKLRRPLKKIIMPPYITKQQINEMLEEMEQQGSNKHDCTGRGQLDRNWESTVRTASNTLKRVPYYGMTEFCTLNRQLSETRTRVELTTSCWQAAAIYVNNNFILDQYLHSNEMFEEMAMMAHTCLMKIASNTLFGVESWKDIDPILRSARHARNMQDYWHAMHLYMQLILKSSHDADSWRELSTCLKDVDRDWANVCINESVVLDPRHPLTLISKGAMVFEDDPASAEPFFAALLAFHPFWATAWVVASVYYIEREMFNMADQIMAYVKRCGAEGTLEDPGFSRTWERELGDWWDPTPLLPGMSLYYDAADLLLRLRAMPLAEVCVSRILSEAGESAGYFHMVALCCRLRGDFEEALCHVQIGIKKYGEISYLVSLQAECYHKLKDIPAASASFDKAGTSLGPYSILLSLPSRDPQRARSMLVDLVRRQPSAYAWVALAEDWMTRAAIGEGGDGGSTGEQVAAKNYAVASAGQALKLDRRAGRAWAQLAKLVKPSARRLYCRNMAIICGYDPDKAEESALPSQQSPCYLLGTAIKDCRCHMCKHLHI